MASDDTTLTLKDDTVTAEPRGGSPKEDSGGMRSTRTSANTTGGDPGTAAPPTPATLDRFAPFPTTSEQVTVTLYKPFVVKPSKGSINSPGPAVAAGRDDC